MCLGVSEPKKQMAAQSTAYALHNWQGKQALAKENEERKSTSVKYLRYMGYGLFSPTMTCQYWNVASYI